MIWEVPGVNVGHWTDREARTGCTVALFPPDAVASGEVRGGAPATREFALLDPLATVGQVDAVVMSGGSAFGLAACDGVAEWCEQQGRGFPTPAGRVPIVVGMSLFDLAVGDARVRPGRSEGFAACEAAPSRELGRVGAGCGATVGSWRGPELQLPGGLVGAVERDGELVVAVLAALNPWGDVVGHGRHGTPPPPQAFAPPPSRIATCLVLVVTNGSLDRVECHHVARGGHDGLARAIDPPHTAADGDAVVAVATGAVAAVGQQVRHMAVSAVERAVRSLPDDR